MIHRPIPNGSNVQPSHSTYHNHSDNRYRGFTQLRVCCLLLTSVLPHHFSPVGVLSACVEGLTKASSSQATYQWNLDQPGPRGKKAMTDRGTAWPLRSLPPFSRRYASFCTRTSHCGCSSRLGKLCIFDRIVHCSDAERTLRENSKL